MTEPRIPTARNVRYYSEIIAGETGIPFSVVHRILMFGWRHICRMIERREDVVLPRLGRLYFEKQPRYVRKKSKPAKEEQQVKQHEDPWNNT